MLEKNHRKPQFCELGNEASTTIKDFLIHESINYQFVLPKDCRVNAVERVIQYFKHQFISGSCPTDPNFPMQLWNNSYLMLKTTSTYSVWHVMTHPNQLVKFSMKITTSILNHEHNLGAKKLSTNIHNPTHLGAQEEMMHGTLVTINVTTHISQKYQICKGVTFLPKICTIPKIKQWDHTGQIAED